MNKLIIDEEALNELGLYGEAIYIIEYDLPKESNKFDKKTNKFLRSMRNNMVYTLKHQLLAHKNLDSSWIIEEDKLNEAESFLNQMKLEYITNPYQKFEMDKKIKVFRIYTDTEGFQSFEDKKAEYLMQELNNSNEKVEKGIQDRIMSESVLWRCKKDVEYVEVKLESLKQHEDYELIVHALVILQDNINEYEKIKTEVKEQKKLEKLSRK